MNCCPVMIWYANWSAAGQAPMRNSSAEHAASSAKITQAEALQLPAFPQQGPQSANATSEGSAELFTSSVPQYALYGQQFSSYAGYPSSAYGGMQQPYPVSQQAFRVWCSNTISNKNSGFQPFGIFFGACRPPSHMEPPVNSRIPPPPIQ